MDHRLDTALQALKHEALDPRLDQLEPRVWSRVEAGRHARESAAFALPVRAAGVAAALALGVMVGGVGASEGRAERQEVAVFSPDARLAPSTLLAGL